MVTKGLPSKLLLFFVSVFYIVSCSKSGNDGGAGTPPPPPPVDKCLGKTIVVSTATTNSGNCVNTGGITVTATGSTSFTYKLNAGGIYQASNTFSNVSAGTHTVFVKDGDGCEQTASVTVASAGQAGPLFTAVRNLMTGTCQPCHNNSIQNGGMNWQVDCNIVANKGRIKVRAVDESSMPPGAPLSAADKKKITDWIAAGGEYAN